MFASHHLNDEKEQLQGALREPVQVFLSDRAPGATQIQNFTSDSTFMLSNHQINISRYVVTVQTHSTSTRRHDLSHAFDGFMPVEVVQSGRDEHNTAQMNGGNTCTHPKVSSIVQHDICYHAREPPVSR